MEARTRAVERLVAEPFAHRIERGVESGRAHVVEESQLPSDLDPRGGHADQTHRTGPTSLTILSESVTQQLTCGAEDLEIVIRRLSQRALPCARLERRDAQMERDRSAAELLGAQTAAHTLREVEEHGLDRRAVERVPIERV